MMACVQEQELLADHDDNGARLMSVRFPIWIVYAESVARSMEYLYKYGKN